jgi:hypothetical protein
MIIRRRFIAGALACSVLLSTSACGQSGDGTTASGGTRYPDYRYRLSVEVDTPEGLRSGSSVIEVRTAMSGDYAIPSPNTLSTRVRGEAVTVDLGQRGVMFALLRSEKSVDWAAGVLGSSAKRVTFEEVHDEIERTNRDPSFDISMQRTLALKGKYNVQRYYDEKLRKPGAKHPPSYYPIMVTFADMTDPKSVTKIDPDNMAARFGKGVKLKRITVERTDDAVTSGIEERLGWLEKIGKTRSTLIPNPPRLLKDATNPIIQYLAPSDFSTEIYK